MLINPYAFGGGGTPFDPLSISWAHAYWTEGTEFVALGLTNGAALSSWPDEAATSDLAQATGANQPTFVTADASFNSRNVVRFDGSNDWMNVDFADLSQPNEIVAVARLRTVPGAAANAILLDGFATTGRHTMYRRGDISKWTMFAGTALSGTATPDLVKHLFRAEFNTTSSKLFVDETQDGSTADAGSNVASGLAVGARFDGTTPGAYDVAFIGVSDSLLTTQQRSDLHSWAQAHYGTA